MSAKKEILFVSHDANRAGAQIFLYNVMESLQQNGYSVILLLVNDWGSFKTELTSKFLTYSLNQNPTKGFFTKKTSTLDFIKKNHSIDLIYVNTIASVHILPELKDVFQKPIVTHIHELSYSIQQYGVPNALELLFNFSDKIIACSLAVAQNLQNEKETDLIEVIHSFVNNSEILEKHKNSDKKAIQKEFNLDSNKTWVAACGNADWRKAPDILVQIAALIKNPNINFAWIGIKNDDPLKQQLLYDAKKLNIQDKITWIAPTPKAVELINSMDYFLLCSREDPFPLVMLEAALCQKPIFTFKNTGGGDEFVEEDAGFRANYLDVNAMAKIIDSASLEETQTLGKNAQAKVLQNYSFEKSILKIETLIQKILK